MDRSIPTATKRASRRGASSPSPSDLLRAAAIAARSASTHANLVLRGDKQLLAEGDVAAIQADPRVQAVYVGAEK